MGSRAIRLNVAMSPDDVFKGVRRLVMPPDSPGRPALQVDKWPSVSSLRFIGELDPPTFWARPQRATGLAHSFTTTFTATVSAQDGGSTILGTFRENPGVRWFGLAFTAVLVIFGFVGLLLPVFGIRPKEGSTIPIVVFAAGMLIAQFVLFRFARIAAAKDEDLLLQRINELFSTVTTKP
jgi:hypothetical protein